MRTASFRYWIRLWRTSASTRPWPTPATIPSPIIATPWVGHRRFYNDATVSHMHMGNNHASAGSCRPDRSFDLNKLINAIVPAQTHRSHFVVIVITFTNESFRIRVIQVYISLRDLKIATLLFVHDSPSHCPALIFFQDFPLPIVLNSNSSEPSQAGPQKACSQQISASTEKQSAYIPRICSQYCFITRIFEMSRSSKM